MKTQFCSVENIRTAALITKKEIQTTLKQTTLKQTTLKQII
jgi:hypothetical protein